MQRIDGLFRWDADSGDEECGFFFDDDLDEVGELAFSVVILNKKKWRLGG